MIISLSHNPPVHNVRNLTASPVIMSSAHQQPICQLLGLELLFIPSPIFYRILLISYAYILVILDFRSSIKLQPEVGWNSKLKNVDQIGKIDSKLNEHL